MSDPDKLCDELAGRTFACVPNVRIVNGLYTSESGYVGVEIELGIRFASYQQSADGIVDQIVSKVELWCESQREKA